jgi:hypothetical protein
MLPRGEADARPTGGGYRNLMYEEITTGGDEAAGNYLVRDVSSLRDQGESSKVASSNWLSYMSYRPYARCRHEAGPQNPVGCGSTNWKTTIPAEGLISYFKLLNRRRAWRHED